MLAVACQRSLCRNKRARIKQLLPRLTSKSELTNGNFQMCYKKFSDEILNLELPTCRVNTCRVQNCRILFTRSYKNHEQREEIILKSRI